MTVTECAALLRENDGFLLLTHTRPDGDTLCSAAALCSALRRLGKRAALFPNPETTEKYLPFVEEYLAGEDFAAEYTVSVDTADANMLPIGFEGEVELAIDHHGSNSGYAAASLVEPQMAACGEIIMKIIEELTGALTPREAELLYVAVSTDCGCFCYGNTTPQTLRDAAHIIEYGVNSGELNKLLFRSSSYARLRLEGLIYSGLKSYKGNRINVAVITLRMLEDCGATENDCDDLASLAGKVEGNVVAITVRELPEGGSKASVRTDETVNAAEICRHFGGGGHPMAAGCTAQLPPYEFADRLASLAGELIE